MESRLAGDGGGESKRANESKVERSIFYKLFLEQLSWKIKVRGV